MKIKPSLPWLPQDAEDNRLMGHLWRRAAGTEGSCPKREAADTACSGTGGVKLAESHGLDETSKGPGAEGNDSGFGACPAGFRFDFGPVFSCCSPFSPHWNGFVYSVPLYAGSMQLVFPFYWGSQ